MCDVAAAGRKRGEEPEDFLVRQDGRFRIFGAARDAADGGKHLRMGGQAKILMWNRESDDATLPALSPTGIAASLPLPTDRWLCVEFQIDARGPASASMQTWVDGAEGTGLHLDATPTPDIDEQWLRKAGWRPPAPQKLPAATLPDDPAVLKLRVRELEEEVRRLRMEKEILQKATAFFASQNP